MIAGKESVANASQLRNIDSKRLVRKIGRLDIIGFIALKEKISRLNFG